MNELYAGIGARATPDFVLTQMCIISAALETEGYILRSGGAKGADSAFECGVDNDRKQIFRAQDCTDYAMDVAEEYHPNWGACSDYVRKLHGRNAMILLGQELNDPVDFVVCWTPQGEITGGTGQSVRMAHGFHIPVYNLALEGWKELMEERAIHVYYPATWKKAI